MSLTDVVRNVAKSVRETLSDRELKEKAKDLPLQILQGALSGMGQALMLGERLRTKLKHLGGQQEETERPSVEEQLSRPAPQQNGEATGEKAKREPVIFAPRPTKPEETPANGSTPATAPADTTAPTPATEPTEPEPAKTAEPTTAAETVTTEPEPAPAADAGELAKAAAATPTEAEPAAVEPGPAAESVTPDTVTTTPSLAEPLPGYANLTLASLRARLRNKSADDIRALIAYEKATSNRANIIKMYENRLAKITAAE